MISAILAILGSSTVGSLLGGVFALLNRKADIEAKRAELAHETARWTHELAVKDKDLEYARVEAAGRKDVAIIEGESAIESARFVAVGQAHQADQITAEELKQAGKWKVLLVFASALRAFIRPVITIVLVAAATYLNWILINRLGDGWSGLSREQQFEVGMQALMWITGQASAVLGYWFVSRNKT